MSELAKRTYPACRQCGAVWTPAAKCWLCGEPSAAPVEVKEELGEGESEDGEPGPLKRASPGESPWLEDEQERAEEALGRRGEGFSFSLSTLLLVMTLAAVCFGLLAVAPGLGIPACIILAPVLVRTSMVVRRREAAGLSVSGPQKIGLAISSFLTVSMIIALAAVASVGTFCAVCLGIYSVGGDRSANAASVAAFLAAAIVSLLTLTAMVRLVRARFRRDVGAPLADGAATAPVRYGLFTSRGANFIAAMIVVGLITWFVQESMSGPYLNPLPLMVGAVIEIGLAVMYLAGRKPTGGKK